MTTPRAARCQHCPNLADERSFMCEDCAVKADTEVNDLREQLAALTRAARGTSSAGGVFCKLCNGPDAQAWEDITHSCPLGGQS
jgi:hypothetical protein